MFSRSVWVTRSSASAAAQTGTVGEAVQRREVRVIEDAMTREWRSTSRGWRAASPGLSSEWLKLPLSSTAQRSPDRQPRERGAGAARSSRRVHQIERTPRSWLTALLHETIVVARQRRDLGRRAGDWRRPSDGLPRTAVQRDRGTRHAREQDVDVAGARQGAGRAWTSSASRRPRWVTRYPA